MIPLSADNPDTLLTAVVQSVVPATLRILAIAAMLMVSCRPAGRANVFAQTVDTRGAEMLWLPATAVMRTIGRGPVDIRHGRNVYIDGTADAYFDITTGREALTTEVIANVERQGWHRLSHQLLNPGDATSFDAGWAHQCACLIAVDGSGRPRPRAQLYSWRGEWENDRRDHLEYYFFAEDRRITGAATFLPATVVDEISRRRR
jgi:hypothetical protein